MICNIALTLFLLLAIDLASSSDDNLPLHQIRRRDQVLKKPAPTPTTCSKNKSFVCDYNKKYKTYKTICVSDPAKHISKYPEDRLGRCEDLCNNIQGCDDGLNCTIDTTTCNLATGYTRNCTFTPVQCESPSTCDSTDGICKATTCTNTIDCNDNDQCTIDTTICDASSGFQKKCVNTPVSCQQDESCNPTDGTCKKDDQLIPCVAVIDEDDSFPSSSGGRNQVQMWTEFRAAYPSRPFCLLVPNPIGYVVVPPSFVSDPQVVINYDIFRDNGVVANAEDWFTKCRLNTLTSANVPFVGLFIDDSGSMREYEVAASRDLLYTALSAKNITVKKVVNGQENWILPFLTTLVR